MRVAKETERVVTDYQGIPTVLMRFSNQYTVHAIFKLSQKKIFKYTENMINYHLYLDKIAKYI